MTVCAPLDAPPFAKLAYCLIACWLTCMFDVGMPRTTLDAQFAFQFCNDHVECQVTNSIFIAVQVEVAASSEGADSSPAFFMPSG